MRTSSLYVLVGMLGGDRLWRHCRAGRLQASRQRARQADAGASAGGDAVVARGAFDGEGAWHGTMTAKTLLGKRQKRILVADVVCGSRGVCLDR